MRTEGLIGCCVICRCPAVTKPMQIPTSGCMRLITWLALESVCVIFATSVIWKDVLMGQMIIVLGWLELHNHFQVIRKFPLSGKFAVMLTSAFGSLRSADWLYSRYFLWSWWWNINTVRLSQVKKTGCGSVGKTHFNSNIRITGKHLLWKTISS